MAAEQIRVEAGGATAVGPETGLVSRYLRRRALLRTGLALGVSVGGWPL
jgi:hypothetical protein